MKSFRERPLSFIYVSRDYIKDLRKSILRKRTFTDFANSIETSMRDKEGPIIYYQDNQGHYCWTTIRNINDSHVIGVIKELHMFGEDDEEKD